MANLSKIRRDRMLAFLDDLKAQQTDESNIREINAIRNELTAKRYGLVWEEHSERVDEELVDNIPVFIEDKSREIVSDENLPYNFLLEGDNLHSLKLLEKTHSGKIDLIYIDPPYNTGARDWKYNNEFVDSNDLYRHSKWISLMNERIKVAYSLLSPSGFFACAIDNYELYSIGLLLNDIFGENNKVGLVTVLHNPKGRNQSKFFSANSEFFLVYAKNKDNADFRKVAISDDVKATFTEEDEIGKFRWEPYVRARTVWSHQNRPDNWYPIYVSSDLQKISSSFINDAFTLYPTTNTGEFSWKNVKTKFDELNKDGYFRAIKVDNKIVLQHKYREQEVLKNVWLDKKYQSEFNGTNILKNILGANIFDYPKSLYLMEDILKITAKKNSTILDFFAGSGTTGHAVLELNKEDGGNRKFILCTNNENNICEEVTYQRLKTVITGKRKDGSEYSEGLPANLKYFKTGWTKRHPENYFLSHQLLLHIKEMIELENAINVDNKKYVIVYSEVDFDKYIRDEVRRNAITKVWISEELALGSEDKKLLKKVKYAYIPREYFQVELQEAGE